LEGLWQQGVFQDNYVAGFRFQVDGRHFTKLRNNQINSYDIINGKLTETIFDASKYKGMDNFSGRIDSYSFSADEKFLLIESESEAIYRHSSKARFYIFDRTAEKFSVLFQGNKQMYASIAPDGQHAAFVVDNDMYIKNIHSGAVDRITKDGKINHIINGATDWVYEEEFSMSRGFEWSPDGKKIAYLRFDESQVPEYTMVNYVDGLYPEYTTFKYPKVGEKNSMVDVFIYDIEKLKHHKVDLPDGEKYIPRIKWTSTAETLCVMTLNRLQNRIQLYLAKSKNGKTDLLLEEKNKYYVDVHDNLTFLKDGKHFIWSSEKDGYNHVYVYDMKGRTKHDLTPGKYDVTEFYGCDDVNQKIYYQVANESPMTRNLYEASLDGKNQQRLSTTVGWNSAQFSATHDYYVGTHSTINTPPTYRVFDRSGKLVRDLELNEESRKNQIEYRVKPVEFFSFKTMDKIELNGYMIKPRDFDESKEYPVFMYLYGGPNSQKAIDQWQGQNYWWFQMLADQGYIIACVDNRGTGARGEEFRKMTYKRLGHFETIDQINAAKYLGDLDYVDKNRIGIFGWSYGAYMSSLCLLKGNDVFKMAIAVAPVTNWRWYDTIYTERFMQTEKENPSGYRENSPVYFANQLKGKYLLVHGGADDNVHVQNSMEMSSALIAANKQFDFYIYPNNNHGIYYGNARLHLYTKMTDFILENL
jgi:dipeptidyl-peptidase-4